LSEASDEALIALIEKGLLCPAAPTEGSEMELVYQLTYKVDLLDITGAAIEHDDARSRNTAVSQPQTD
jgi:hypothetical protein